MDVFNKFIIETDDELGDCLILGRVTYHNQLAFEKEKVKSGGWWNYFLWGFSRLRTSNRRAGNGCCNE